MTNENEIIFYKKSKFLQNFLVLQLQKIILAIL